MRPQNQAVILLSLAIVGCSPRAISQQLETVTIAKVSDGDTVRLQDGRKIRFCGIDAPEKAQPLGTESTAKLTTLIQGEVKLQAIETDKYQRTVAELWVKRPGENIYTSVNAAMTQAGMAWHYAKYSQNCPSRAAIVAGETEAKGKRLGIWQGVNTPAWEYRKQQRR
jgi:endonuclease YncB( thermonuclease family)